MRTFFIIVTNILTLQCLSQDAAEKISNKAFNFYSPSNNFDSALFYYTKLQSEYPNFRTGYITHQIGSCFLELKHLEKAKTILITSLRLRESTDTYPEGACLKIADIFFDGKDYYTALNYYDSSTSFYKIKNIYGTRHRYKEGSFTTIYKKAICFDKINRLDTAINILTPRIFLDFESHIGNSTELEEIVDFYITLLKKKYSLKVIRNEFKKSLAQLTYKRENDTSLLSRDSSWKSIKIECYMYFLGKQIYLGGGGVGVKDFNEETPVGWRKKDILDEFYTTPCYKKLKSL